MPARKIIHVDMDAFYTSVEQRDDPQTIMLGTIMLGSRFSKPRPIVRITGKPSVVSRKVGCHATVTVVVEKCWKTANKS